MSDGKCLNASNIGDSSFIVRHVVIVLDVVDEYLAPLCQELSII